MANPVILLHLEGRGLPFRIFPISPELPIHDGFLTQRDAIEWAANYGFEITNSIINPTRERLRLKANQEWDMAGCARQDNDMADSARRINLARAYSRIARTLDI